MKFKTTSVIVATGTLLVQEWDEDTDSPQEWAEETMQRFNDTLRPRESPRKLISVEVVSEAFSKPKHTWEKDLTRMSVSDHIGNYDGYTCTFCGITGKAFGLTGVVVRDSKYKAKVYGRCDTAKAHIEKKRTAQKED